MSEEPKTRLQFTDLPEGTVTFLFTDIEGSTQLLSQLRDQYAGLLSDQRRILRDVFANWHGQEVDTQGDAFFVAFPRATEAICAAVEIQCRLAAHQWPEDVQVQVRMGLHTGEPLVARTGYVGMDVHRAARIAHVGHGGQVLLSETTTSLVVDDLPEDVELLDLGRHLLKDMRRPEHIHQLVIEGLPGEFPPLRSLDMLPLTMADLPGGTVTFLFTDIEGSTELWDLNPKGMKASLERHNLLLHEEIAGHGGRVFKVIGDEFQAAFTQPLQAVEAAVAVQRALHGEDWGEPGPIRVRMGIHVGLGEVKGADYESSHTLNRVARISAAGHGGQTLISHVAADMVRGRLPEGVHLLDMGEHLMKGIAHPEHIFQVIAPDLPQDFPPLKSLKAPLPEVILDMEDVKLPPFLEQELEDTQTPLFVGRERELERLDGYLQRMLAGEGEVVFVTGGPGRGKTALMEAFSRRTMEIYPDLLVASGSCNAYTGIGDPYLPFKEIFDLLTGAVESKYLSGNISKEHALRLWEVLPLTLEGVFNYGPHIVNSLLLAPALKSRAEVAIPGNVHLIQKLDASILSQRVGSDDIEQSHLFQQITNVLQKLAANHPLLLLLDDLQWADSASINLLFHIGRRLQGSRILIIAAYRPVDIALGRNEKRHPLKAVLAEFKRMYGDVWVNLGRSEEENDRRFVGLLLDTEANLLDSGFRNTLFKHTSGHPLFTIELLRALQERRDLVKNPEGYWITTPELDWNTIPARIEGVIEERIGRLDDDLREILTIASVEGEEFTLQVITILKGGNERLLLNSLSQELEKKHRLIKEQSIRHVEDKRLHTFRFRHNLFQQYLYGELGAIEREWLHGEIAVTLEDLYSEEAQQIAPQLAYHFRLAGNSKKAQRYLVEAGRQARDRYANQEAVEYYSQALGLIQKEDVSSHYKILLEREKVHALIGNRQERATDLDSLDLLVADLGDMEKQAEVSLRRAKFAGSTGDYPEAIVAAEQSANFAGVAGFEELVASAQTEWGRALAFTGELDQARAHLMEALKLARDAQATTGAQTSWLNIEAGSLNNLGYIYNIQGDHSSSSAYLEQALAIHRQIGDRRGEGVMLQNLGVVHYDQGDFVNAEIYWEQALRIFQEIGDRQHEAMVMNSLGNISSDLRGDYIEAQLKYGQALTIAQEVGDRLTEGMLLANIGLALSYQHNFDESQGYIHQAMEIYVDIDLKPELGGIYLDSGNTLIGLKQLDEAVNNYTEAIHYAKEFDNRENILEAQAGLARISHLKGEKVKALTLVDAILIQMDKDQAQNPIEPEAAMRVYLICYQILQANLDPRVEEVLQMAYTLLQEQADRITEEGIRQKFLENIPWHREIVENYLKNL